MIAYYFTMTFQQESGIAPYPLILSSNKKLKKILADYFAEQGGERRQAVACQARQRSYAK